MKYDLNSINLHNITNGYYRVAVSGKPNVQQSFLGNIFCSNSLNALFEISLDFFVENVKKCWYNFVIMVSVPDCLERISTVLQLLGQLENAGPPPASKDAIEKLPTITVTKEDVGKIQFLMLYC